jgi:phospholipid/cholesterol/gamma-HCH transport system substrate-binding protein
MAKVTQAAKVGLFVLASAGGVAAISRTISKGVSGGRGYVVNAKLKDATGLVNHSRVTMAGIPIGTIEAIRLEGGLARVEIRVSDEVPLYANATVGKKSTSLLGEFTLVVNPGTEDRPRLHNGDEVPVTLEQATTDQIMNDVARIADRVKAVSERLADALGTERGGQNIQRIVDNVADATEAINLTVRENRQLIHDTLTHVNNITGRGEPEVLKILENVRVVTEDIRVLMAAQGDKPGATAEIRETIERINRASKSLESTMAHLDTVTGRLDRGEGTLGRLSKDEALVDEVQGVAENLGEIVDRIGQVQTVVGLRSDYNFLANTVKSYVELRLQPREDKYYLVELINDPRGLTKFEQKDVNTTNPKEPSNYRTVTVTTTDAFRFSLQFARRIGPFTGRFGIKESTGGLGLDGHFFGNRLEFVQDLFGFGEDIKPRYRLYLGYQFIKNVWLMGGVDHLFFDTRRDYFLGLALRFNDQDLKGILPFMPTGAATR